MKRFWDPENRYTDAVLKEYKHWVLETSYHQHTLGCYVVFFKRKNVEKLSALKDKEFLELKTVLKEIEKALLKNKTFKPDRFNYLQLGNGLHQLHVHGVPRYLSDRKFLGRTWKDPDPTNEPQLMKTVEPRETVIALREEMSKYLV